MTEDSRRDVWQAVEDAHTDGWTSEMSETGHLTLRAPQGGHLVFTTISSAHRRTAGNVRALVARYGPRGS